MRKALVLVIMSTMALPLLSGCAVVSNMRTREGDSETHIVAILGIPLWVSAKPVEQRPEKE